jgi:hypothetical protein
MLASVAYATEDRTSLEKTASAFHFGSRSSISWAVVRGRPNTSRRAANVACPRRVRGSIAVGRATITPGPE